MTVHMLRLKKMYAEERLKASGMPNCCKLIFECHDRRCFRNPVCIYHHFHNEVVLMRLVLLAVDYIAFVPDLLENVLAEYGAK